MMPQPYIPPYLYPEPCLWCALNCKGDFCSYEHRRLYKVFREDFTKQIEKEQRSPKRESAKRFQSSYTHSK